MWSENRADVAPYGDFRVRRDFGALPDAPSQDVFLVKFSYWLPICCGVGQRSEAELPPSIAAASSCRGWGLRRS
ncbi:MAG: hypothetical protein ACXW2P_11125, partial [Thermoanaerobaculia bacterium]